MAAATESIDERRIDVSAVDPSAAYRAEAHPVDVAGVHGNARDDRIAAARDEGIVDAAAVDAGAADRFRSVVRPIDVTGVDSNTSRVRRAVTRGDEALVDARAIDVDVTGTDLAQWCKEIGFERVDVVPLAGPTSAGIASSRETSTSSASTSTSTMSRLFAITSPAFKISPATSR